MTDSIESKQNYLRENILARNYDTNQFVQFLQSKRGEGGADIANWTMEDLKKVVQEFIDNINYQNNQVLQQNNLQTNPQSNPLTGAINPTVSIEQQKRNSTINELKNAKDNDYGVVYPDYYIGTKTDVTKLSNYDVIDIKVTTPEKVEGGFFTKSFITVQISTLPLNLNIKRKYSDFIWLRQIASTLFHTSLIPKISQKPNKMFEKEKGEFYKQKRTNQLEKFLNFLAKDNLIKNSNLFYDFLSVDKDEEFSKKKRTYEKLKTPVILKDMKSPNGNISVQVTEEKETYFNNIKDNLGYNENFMRMLKVNMKDLNEEINKVVIRLKNISIIFKKLFKISEKYFDNSTIIESYRQMNHMFLSWSDTLKNQNSFVNSEIREYFKFLGFNFKYLRDLTQLVDSHKATYKKASKSLMAKKLELFKKKDLTKWELSIEDKNNVNLFVNDKNQACAKICYKDTSNVIYLKQEYGYYLNRIISEYERLRYINGVVNKEKTILYSKNQSDMISAFYRVLGEIITVMDSCVNIASDSWKSQGLMGQQNIMEAGFDPLQDSQYSVNAPNAEIKGNENQNNQ